MIMPVRHDTKFIEITVINCNDPKDCFINYLDPQKLFDKLPWSGGLQQSLPGYRKHRIKLNMSYVYIEQIFLIKFKIIPSCKPENLRNTGPKE